MLRISGRQPVEVGTQGIQKFLLGLYIPELPGIYIVSSFSKISFMVTAISKKSWERQSTLTRWKDFVGIACLRSKEQGGEVRRGAIVKASMKGKGHNANSFLKFHTKKWQYFSDCFLNTTHVNTSEIFLLSPFFFFF